MNDAKVCIIGAGCSGLVAAKILHQRGIPFDCFEKGSGIGGMWRYNNDNGMSSAYASLHINTSRQKMQFADFPMPKHYPDFPHHSQILDYFESYVDHFGFRDRIAFRTSVNKVEPQRDGTHLVEFTGPDGGRSTRSYGAVLVANGHHWCPNHPNFSGSFTGETLHSHDYRVPENFRDRRVLVVGMGNSACDIACEVSRLAKKTFLSISRGAHVIPKYLFGKPLDQVCPPWLWRFLPFWLFQMLFAAALRLSRGRLGRFLPAPNHKILQEHPTISSDLLNLIGHGRIHILPALTHLAGRTVEFADGHAEEVDAIIYATGYKIAFPFLDDSILNPSQNEVNLYKLVVHPEYPNLFFIGLIQPWGAIMPLSEMQSEWVADLLTGLTSLPERETMRRDIERARLTMQQRYVRSPRHTIQVDFYPYLNELRKERRRPPARAVKSLPIPAPQSPCPSLELGGAEYAFSLSDG